jgi:tetratricopeptide (TPR) repeat protein
MDDMKAKPEDEQKVTLMRLAIMAGLAFLVISVYWPAAWFDFIELDDNLYLLENPNIKMGLSPAGIKWAFTTFHTTNWHPLTWILLLAEFSLSGLNPAGFHIVGVLLHIINTALLFLVMVRITGGKWKAMAAAALFAVHPMNIESAAWIAEQKNLLSTLFWFLTILAYLRYAKKPGPSIYLATLGLFALGLMAKPMLVSLPFILLLFDYWPLGRLYPVHFVEGAEANKKTGIKKLLIEKIPFFSLAFFSVLLTLYAAHAGGAMKSLETFPLYGRMANALVSYSAYVAMLLWPFDLSIFYPHSSVKPLGDIAAAFFALSATSGLVVWKGSKYRYLTVGWLWYLVTLLPVIGLVQVGFQEIANRYMYVPSIGIFLIFAMGLPDIAKRFSKMKPFLPALMALPVVLFTVSSAFELPHWQNTETAFTRALEVTKDNHVALLGLGNLYQKKGDIKAAETHFRAALRVKPDYAEAHNNLAVLLMRSNRGKEAEFHLREAIRHLPRAARSHNNLGALLAGQGRLQEARPCFEKALEINPDYAEARANLSLLLAEK